jgi:hypothetical protein
MVEESEEVSHHDEDGSRPRFDEVPDFQDELVL